MINLRFDDGENDANKEEKEEVEEVVLHETVEGEEDIDELRGFMFNMLRALLFDVVVGA